MEFSVLKEFVFKKYRCCFKSMFVNMVKVLLYHKPLIT